MRSRLGASQSDFADHVLRARELAAGQSEFDLGGTHEVERRDLSVAVQVVRAGEAF